MDPEENKDEMGRKVLVDLKEAKVLLVMKEFQEHQEIKYIRDITVNSY
jgi:hypothetical protein